MKVLVCDDDDKFLKIIREYLQQIGSEQNLQLEILGIQNPDELMEQVKKNPDIQLIFLDIIFEGSENNGIKIAEEIQKVNNRDVYKRQTLSYVKNIRFYKHLTEKNRSSGIK